MRRNRSKTQSGQALIEFALSFASLAVLGIAAVSFGMAVQNSEVVADAAYAGAAYGANSTYNSVNTATMQQVALNSAAGVRNLTATATYWCTCTAGGALVSCSSACGTDQPMYYVQVTVSATYPNFFHYGSLPATFTIQSSCIMPVD
jgi:Flp pilus assembly protein TadG